jgi:CelD/BcsL family acetyltransferase involved in cellulose biosynthesis/Tfp pilus assembly protein PilF
MRVDVIDTAEKLAALEANWNAVYDADPDAHFFLSFPWISKWLARVTYPSLVLAVRADEDASDYVAFLPIWIKTKERKTGELYNVVHMGGNHFSDYTGLLCRPELQELAIPALADGLKQLNWRQIYFQDIRISDERLAILMKSFRKKDFNIEEEAEEIQDGINLNISPAAQLADSWDAYLDTKLSANTRQKLRRLLRQFEASKDLRITHADKDTLDRDIEILLRFWADRWGRQKGDRLEGILENNRVMLRHMFAAGRLFLPIMWNGEKPVGALSIFTDPVKKACHFLAGGRDQMFQGPSPGLLMHAYSIRHAIQEGFRQYDFMRGDESYKYSFGVENSRLRTLIVATNNKKNLGGKLDIHCIEIAIRRALQNHRNGLKEKAEVGYRTILEVSPKSIAAHYGLGRILAERGDQAAAMDHYRVLLESHPDGYQPSFLLARSLQTQGKLAEAADAYCQGIEREPKSSDAYFDLGHVLRQLRLYELAIAAFEVVTELEPEFPTVDEAKINAVKARDRQKPDEYLRATAESGAMGERVAKLKAIARVLERKKPKADVPLVLEWQQKGPERPFTFSRSIMPTVGGKAPTKN